MHWLFRKARALVKWAVGAVCYQISMAWPGAGYFEPESSLLYRVHLRSMTYAYKPDGMSYLDYYDPQSSVWDRL